MKAIREYGGIAVGAFVLAVAVNVFLLPLNISTGGVSGIGTILYHTVKIPIWATTLAVNSVLFLFGRKMLAKSELVKSAVGILLLTAFLALTENASGFGGDLFVSAVFGGAVAGAGVGITVKCGASTGGSDFAGIMVNRALPHISVAGFIMLADCAVVALSGIIFGEPTLTLYSLVSLYVSSRVTDRILVSGRFAKCLYIISEKHEQIARRIMTEAGRGVTGIESTGLYTGTDGVMLMCAVGKKEAFFVIEMVKAIDPNAFTVVVDAREVYGNGFVG